MGGLQLEHISIGVAILSLFVSIAAFVFVDREKNPGIRYGCGVIFFSLALVFALVAVFAIMGSFPGYPPNPTSVATSVMTRPNQGGSGSSTSATSTPPPIQQPKTNITDGDIDSLLGRGNWFCLDDYQNGIGVRNLLSNIRIEYPWEAADKFERRFNYGEVVPADGPATLWLQESFSRGYCPNTGSGIQGSISQSTIDELLGQGNWYCLSDYDNGIAVRNVPHPIPIEYPWEAADKFEQRYNFGDTVPSEGPATFWLQNSLPQAECP